MTLQGFNQAVLSELFIIRVVGFGYAVGVEGEGVAWAKLAFSNFAIPILEDSQDRGGGLEALDCIIAAEEQGDRKSTRLNSSHTWISYSVLCLRKKTY